jgi:hypothetical protein
MEGADRKLSEVNKDKLDRAALKSGSEERMLKSFA